jgi:DNA polymerase III subunit chi
VQVDFYHLTRMPLERALPQIADKVVASGARLLVVDASAERRAALDRALWSYAADSFLPHGVLRGDEADARQPVLIAADVNAANGARHIALVDGSWRDAALDFDRAFHFFDEDHIRAAREAWKALAARDDITRRYWKQNDAGRWEQAA